MKGNPVAKHAHKFNKSAVHKDKKKAMKKGERKHKGSYESVEEKLNTSDGIAAWIKDFQSSDAPQFQGKSDAKRKEMAIAAYLDAKKGSKGESMNEKTLHINLDAKDSPRQRQVTSVLKRYEKSGAIEFDGETDKGALFKINKPGVENTINKELRRLAGGYRLGESMKEVKEPTGDLKNACWKGYTAVGTKKKNGKTVPNCVPKKESMDPRDFTDKAGYLVVVKRKGGKEEIKNFFNTKPAAQKYVDRIHKTNKVGDTASIYKTDGRKMMKEGKNTPGDGNPCWDTHKKVGTKMKNGKRVNDCVPKEEVEIEEDVHARYMRAHGKKAKGQGQWMFTTSRTGDTQGKEFSQRGDFSAAHKAAQKHFGTKNVYVMEWACNRTEKTRRVAGGDKRKKYMKEKQVEEGSAQDRLNQRAAKLGIGNRNKAADDYMARMKAKHGEKGVADRLASNQAKIDAIKKARQRKEENLDEISSTLKKNYRTKARADVDNQYKKGDMAAVKGNQSAVKQADRRVMTRRQGIQRSLPKDSPSKSGSMVPVRNKKYVKEKQVEGKLPTAFDRQMKNKEAEAAEKKNKAEVRAARKDQQRNDVNSKVNEELTPVQKRKYMNLKKRAKAGNSQAKIRLKSFEKEFAKDIEMEKGSAKKVSKAVKGKGVGDVSTQQAFSGKGGGKGDDDNLIVQLRKAQDLNGKMDIKVTPAGKTAQLPKALIDKLLKGYDNLQKPEDKKKFKLLLTKELRKRAK